MATIRPFAGLRPDPAAAARVAALPYDVYNRAEALREAEREPLSFLKIDRAEVHFGPEVSAYDSRVYEKAAALLQEAEREGIFIREEEPCLYLYELTREGRRQTGVVGCAAVDDYLTGVVKKHENTRADKEEDRVRHVEACGAQTGPIFLACRSFGNLCAVLKESKKAKPLYDFVSPDGIGHRIFKIAKPDQIRAITEGFAAMPALYIADGHHRAASAVRAALRRRKACPGYTGKEEWNYFLSVVFCAEELRILSYNRVVRDLNGLTPGAFLECLNEKCQVTGCGEKEVRPQAKGEIGLYLAGSWYHLAVRPQWLSADPVEGLDVAFLQREILAPYLGIGDPRTDSRIDFVGGIRGLSELKRRCETDMAAAFAMYPTDIGELFAVADAGLLMPPKSTWFEPKLRSGLLIHKME